VAHAAEPTGTLDQDSVGDEHTARLHNVGKRRMPGMHDAPWQLASYATRASLKPQSRRIGLPSTPGRGDRELVLPLAMQATSYRDYGITYTEQIIFPRSRCRVELSIVWIGSNHRAQSFLTLLREVSRWPIDEMASQIGYRNFRPSSSGLLTCQARWSYRSGGSDWQSDGITGGGSRVRRSLGASLERAQ